MNEQIRELAKSVQCERHWTEEDIEKFAELIVAECAKILDTEMYRLDALPGREVSAQAMETASILVKKHFGVE
jgi:hypothetical protein